MHTFMFIFTSNIVAKGWTLYSAQESSFNKACVQPFRAAGAQVDFLYNKKTHLKWFLNEYFTNQLQYKGPSCPY